MKVVEKQFSEKALEDWDYRSYLAIEVNGREAVSFLDGEPEDNNISRNFNGVLNITALMREAHEAGRRREDFDWEYVEVDDVE